MKKKIKVEKVEVIEETTIEVEVPVVDESIVEKVNELEEFIRIAEKYNIHRMRQAYHLLSDAKK